MGSERIRRPFPTLGVAPLWIISLQAKWKFDIPPDGEQNYKLGLRRIPSAVQSHETYCKQLACHSTRCGSAYRIRIPGIDSLSAHLGHPSPLVECHDFMAISST